MMTKNMREFVQVNHKNQRTKNASEVAKCRVEDMITKNEERTETHKKR